MLPHTHWIRSDIDTHDVRGAACRAYSGGQNADNSSFARAIWSQHPKDFSLLHRKCDTIDCIGSGFGIAFNEVVYFDGILWLNGNEITMFGWTGCELGDALFLHDASLLILF